MQHTQWISSKGKWQQKKSDFRVPFCQTKPNSGLQLYAKMIPHRYQANFWGEKTRHYVVIHLFQLIKLKHRAGPAESKEFSKTSAWQLQILQTTAAVMDWGIHSLVLRVADLEKQGGREEMSLVWCLDRTWGDAAGPGASGCQNGRRGQHVDQCLHCSLTYPVIEVSEGMKHENWKPQDWWSYNPWDRLGQVMCINVFLVQKVFRDVRPDYEQFWTLRSSNRRCVLMKISAMVACRTLSNRGTARNLGTKPTTHLDIVALQHPD